MIMEDDIEYKELEEIVKNGEEKVAGFAIKIFIISEMRNYSLYNILTNNERAKLLDYIYAYWNDNDFVENHLSDIVWLVFEISNIIDDIKKIRYGDFEKIMDKLV